ALVTHTRTTPEFVDGLSPRAAIALASAARAYALLQGRDAVYPEDLQAVFPAVAGHRLRGLGTLENATATERAAHVLDRVAIP
ncbi:MAG: AAA family ATPase, partial [Pseudomonadota bacterium]